MNIQMIPNYLTPQEWNNRITIGDYTSNLNKTSAVIDILETLLSLVEFKNNKLLQDSLYMYEQEYKEVWSTMVDCIKSCNEYIENGGQ